MDLAGLKPTRFGEMTIFEFVVTGILPPDVEAIGDGA